MKSGKVKKKATVKTKTLGMKKDVAQVKGKMPNAALQGENAEKMNRKMAHTRGY